MDRILIMVASYGDPDLVNTMQNAIEMARFPERVHFAVCLQDDASSLYHLSVRDFPRTKMVLVPPSESKGTCYARHLTQLLMEDEEYILQIDSHNRFIRNWDEECLAMLRECPGDKCYLTAYCEMLDAYREYRESLETGNPIVHRGYTLGADYFLTRQFPLLFHGSYMENRTTPYPGAFASGHFIFAPSLLMREVTYDPAVYFHGEEISFAVRSWTHGWDIYHPYKALVYHEFEEVALGKVKYRKSHSDLHVTTLFDSLSKAHVTELLSAPPENRDYGKYGFGHVRSLEEYMEFSGVDFFHKTLKYKAVAGFYDETYSGRIFCHSLGKELEWSKALGEEEIIRNEDEAYALRSL